MCFSVCSCQDRGGVGGSQSQVEVLKQTLQMFSVPDELNWLGEGDKVEVLENSWTDIVHSHNVHNLQILASYVKQSSFTMLKEIIERRSGVCDGTGE